MAFTTKVQPVTLTASDVKATTATLTIANHSGDWHYKHTTPTGGQCSAAVSGTVANLTGLTANTDYVFAAYSDGGCATGLGVQVGFRTKPETSGTTTTPTTTTDTTTDTTEPKVEPVEQPDPEPVATAPPAPSRPTAVAGNARVTLRWRSNGDGDSDITKWQYAVATEGGFGNWIDMAGSGASTTEHLVEALANGIVHRFKVRAVNAVGEGEESSASDGVTPATTPAAPSQPLATFGNGQVRLDWRSNGDGGSAITGWQYVQASDGGFGDWIDVADAGADTTSHVVEGLVNGTAYRFKVRAVNALGKGDESPETALATPATVALAPTKPEVLSGNAQVSISWRSNGDGGRPILRWEYAIGSGGGYGHWEEIPGSGVATTEHVATGLANGTAYRFKVRAATALGAGEESPESESVVPATTPSAPSGLVVVASLSDFTLTWTSNGDGGLAITGWQYAYRNGGRYSEWTDIPGSGPDTTSYTVQGLAKETAYRFKVRAVNALGEGEESAVSSAVTLLDAHPEFVGIGVADLILPRNEPIDPVLLPVAWGGDGALTYALAPALPAGLHFDAATRTLSGTPVAVFAPQTFRYTVTDADVGEPDSAELTFAIEVVVSQADRSVMEDAAAAHGRALLSSVTGVIGERFRGASRSHDSFGSAVVPPSGDANRSRGMRPLQGDGSDGAGLRWYGTGPGAQSRGTRHRDLVDSGTDMLWGRSFATRLKARGSAQPGPWTLWGAADMQRFDGLSGQSTYGGDVRSIYVGMDANLGGEWLAGGALARQRGEVDYRLDGGVDGRVVTELAGFHPYVRGRSGSGLEFWALGGYASGTATDRRRDGDDQQSDLAMAVGAAGVRQDVAEWNSVRLSVVGGAGLLSLAADEGAFMVNSFTADIHRVRLALEASRPVGAFSPYMQFGGRSDGGDGDTGLGMEMVAGLRYAGERLDFEARGRWLTAHAAKGQEEYGAMTRLTLRARPDGTGLQLRLMPSWGLARQGSMLLDNTDDLLGGGAMPGLGSGAPWMAGSRGLALDSELGYSVAVAQLKGLVTPTLSHGLQGITPLTRFGLDYQHANPANQALGFRFSFGYELRKRAYGAGYHLQMNLTNRF